MFLWLDCPLTFRILCVPETNAVLWVVPSSSDSSWCRDFSLVPRRCASDGSRERKDCSSISSSVMDSSNFREYSVATDVLSPREKHRDDVRVNFNCIIICKFQILYTWNYAYISSGLDCVVVVTCHSIPLSSTQGKLSLHRESFAAVRPSSSMELLSALLSFLSSAPSFFHFSSAASVFICDGLLWLLLFSPLKERERQIWCQLSFSKSFRKHRQY